MQTSCTSGAPHARTRPLYAWSLSRSNRKRQNRCNLDRRTFSHSALKGMSAKAQGCHCPGYGHRSVLPSGVAAVTFTNTTAATPHFTVAARNTTGTDEHPARLTGITQFGSSGGCLFTVTTRTFPPLLSAPPPEAPPVRGQEVNLIFLYAQADGPLREAFGVPEGTPGQATITQFSLSFGHFFGASFPVERIDLRVLER